jgi:HEAT repeat protein
MERRNLFVALLCACCLSGCTKSPPPVASPAESNPTEPTETVKPAEPEPKPVMPAVAPKVEQPQTPPDSPLRNIAARLVVPAGEGGWRIDEAGALELERLGNDAPAQLLGLLTDPQLEVRRGAAFHLLSSFNPAAKDQVAAFSGLLEDQNATIRGIGLSAVMQMQPDDVDAVQPQLIALLQSANESKPENRATIARFAGRLMQRGAPFAASLTTAATDDPDERVRSAAVFALTQVSKPEQFIPTLIQVLSDPTPNVRLVAAGRLRALGPSASPAVDALGKALGDEDERVRTAAAEALTRIGLMAVPTLGQLLSSQDVNVRKLALACLSGLGAAAKSELPKIEKLQQDPDQVVREAAKNLVERLKK